MQSLAVSAMPQALTGFGDERVARRAYCRPACCIPDNAPDSSSLQHSFGSSPPFSSSPLPSTSYPGTTKPIEPRPKFRSKNSTMPGSENQRPKPGTPRPYDPTKQKSKVMEWLTPPKPPTELLQREHFKLSDTCSCTIFFGDLSKWTVDGKSDAVIAPANKKLNTGPAVNAVLFKAAGPKMLECTSRLPDVAPQGIKAEMGDAISTRAYDLPVSRVIHTVGSVYKKNEAGFRESDAVLEKAYKSALMVARKQKLKYLSFPPLSCNIYGYPYSDGAEVALRTLKANCEGFLQIDVVIRNIEGYEAFLEEAHKVLEHVKQKKTLRVKLGPDGKVVSGTVVGSSNALPNSPYVSSSSHSWEPLPSDEDDANMEQASVSPRERTSPVPPAGPPPTPPSSPTMTYTRTQYESY